MRRTAMPRSVTPLRRDAMPNRVEPMRRTPMPKAQTREQRDPLWGPARRAVITRDGGCCVMCGVHVGDSIDVHHRVLLGMGGSLHDPHRHDPARCVSLCRGCHTAVHDDTDGVTGELGFIVKHWQDPARVPLRTPTGWVYLTDMPVPA